MRARNLGIDFGGLHAVEDFNLIIGKTEIAGLIGPNGAGKTTVFNLLTKVYQPTMGTIMLNGRDTAGMNTAQANKLGIARTFQNIRLFDNMSVEDIHYDIAEWAIAGNRLTNLGFALWYFNPFSPSCRPNFPSNVGEFVVRIGNHCFYNPTDAYADT